MRLEQIPLYIGVVVAILGVGLVLDAQLPDRFRPSRERRRRERAERHRTGETLVGLGVIGMAAALIGRDTWRFGTVVVLISAVMLGAGGWLNREYLRELLLFRGPARRGEKRSSPRAPEPASDRQSDSPQSSRAQRPPPKSGLADSPPARSAKAVRGDREAPIMTATEGVPRRNRGPGEDTPPEGRLRVR